jgi:hypothetical protein
MGGYMLLSMCQAGVQAVMEETTGDHAGTETVAVRRSYCIQWQPCRRRIVLLSNCSRVTHAQ